MSNNQWEQITSTTSRLKVPGGWIVLYSCSFISNTDDCEKYGAAASLTSAMCFVPDPREEWGRNETP